MTPSDISATNALRPESRRDFLRQAVNGAALLGAAGFLGACGASSATPSTSSQPAKNAPKRGGTITHAGSGGSSSDTLDANACVNVIDFTRAPSLYDTLVETNADYVPEMHLAEEITPNKNATEWTIRVRKGIQFHNGKDFTIDDVIYTFNRIITKKLSAASELTVMDLKNARKLDKYTIKIPMNSPYSILPQIFVGNGEMSIVPIGYNPKQPVGTGPFKYKSFTPGRQSVFTRNANYFVGNEPYVDTLIIDDYSNEQSQVNALLSNQATTCDQLTFGSIAALRSGQKVANAWNGPGWLAFVMRVDVPPFDDVRVRQALRLVVDRPQMREVAYGGYGFIGNDIFGRSSTAYANSGIPQRVQDIPQAKHLLKKAGQENLKTTLVTGPIKGGAVQLATAFKQQAAAAGVTVNLDVVTSGTVYGPNFLKWHFTQDGWSGYPYLHQVALSNVPGAPWDETHWAQSPYISQYLKLYREALATVDVTKRGDIIHEMMRIDWDSGGYIIPAFNPVIVGQQPNLKGVVKQETGDPWIEWRFRMMWLD